MKRYFTAFLLFSVLVYAGCGNPNAQKTSLNDNSKPIASDFKKINIVEAPLKIVTSFYPLYEIAKQVGGNNVIVKNLVPVGAEPHDYEPTPQDVVQLHEADLVMYNGAGLEPWVDKLIPELQKNGVKTLNVADIFQNSVIKNGPKDPEEEEYLPYDPHFWLDPVNYQKEVQAISQKIVELNSIHQADYQQNSQAFLKQLADLNLAYENGFKNCKLDTFVTNHAAFAYLSNRYHLNMIPISGLSPDAEPSSKIMANLVGTIRQKNIHYVLTESLVSPKVANTLANETGAKTLVLNPLEGLADEEIAQGKNYVSVMNDNLQNLQTALECQ